MFKKILILIGFLALFLPAICFAANEPTITQNGKTVTITISNITNPDTSKLNITFKRNSTYIKLDGHLGESNDMTFVDTPEPPGAYTYIVTIDDEVKLSQAVTTTDTPSTATTGKTILPNDKPPVEQQNLDTIKTLIANIGQLMLTLGGGLAVIYIIIGAYNYFFAFGSEERAGAGKKTITWAIVGLVVILLSKVILTFIWNRVATDANPINFFF